jgi:hypothetical protein
VSGVVIAVIIIAGALAGVIAQLLRQHVGPLSTLGAATAPWVNFGFVCVVTRRLNGGFLERALNGAVLMAAYLFSWLLSYHTLFAIQQSVSVAVAWSQARPWIVAVAPASAVVGFLVASRRWNDWRTDACMSVALAVSFPEVLRAFERGWTYMLIVGAPTAAVGALPLTIVARGRRTDTIAVVVSSVALALVAYVLFPHLPTR